MRTAARWVVALTAEVLLAVRRPLLAVALAAYLLVSGWELAGGVLRAG